MSVAIALCGCLIVLPEPRDGTFTLIPDPECPAHQEPPGPDGENDE